RVNDLWGSELVLMDINDERLNVMKKIVEGVIQTKGVGLKISATTNLREALEGADFVIVTIRVGGLDALRDLIEIPLRFGTMEVVGDTVGPSGVLKGMLEIPAVVDIANKVKDVSPEAVILNFTNPMTPICRAVRKTTNLEMIGLCHGVHHIRKLASSILRSSQHSPEELDVDAAGINHLTWTVGIRYEGRSVYEEFLRNLFSQDHEDIIARHPYLIGRELYGVFGVPPTLSDRHTSEFFHYLYDWISDPIYGPILRKTSGYIEYENKTLSRAAVENEEKRMRELRKMAEGPKDVEISPTGEYALDIISASKHDKRKGLLAANIPNGDTIKGIASEYIVEVPVEVDKHGFTPTGRISLPRPIISVLSQHLVKFETLVDGILERDKDLIVQAIAMDPLTPSPCKAEKIFSLFVERCSDSGFLSF
ncbi:MAG: family 4 glycosyl hydrolase, partial [Candidatus Thorarchaeota archaeon]